MHPGDEAAAASHHNTEPITQTPMSAEDERVACNVLATEYSVLTTALTAARYASLTRTCWFLGMLSAAGIALGLASQGGVDRSTFLVLALLVLMLVLFLGIATFIQLVEVQRESIVYITGMNRIRHFFREVAPASRPPSVLAAYHFDPALRGIETGVSGIRRKTNSIKLTVQLQGIVGIATGLVAAGCGRLVGPPGGSVVAWLTAAMAFLVTLAALSAYWYRSLAKHAAQPSV